MTKRLRIACMVAVLVGSLLPTAFFSTPAQAGIFNPIPLDAALDPTDEFKADDALFVYFTVDITGGDICIVNVDVIPAPGVDCRSGVAWGSPNHFVGLGSMFEGLEAPFLAIGTWRLLAAPTPTKAVPRPVPQLSIPFHVSPCGPTCDTTIGQEAIDAWKVAAGDATRGGAVACAALGLQSAAAGAGSLHAQVVAMRAALYDAIQNPIKVIRAAIKQVTVELAVEFAGGIIGIPMPEYKSSEEMAIELLKQLLCSEALMYATIQEDPPDTNFTTVAQPRFATIPDPLSPAGFALAVSADRQRALGEAMLHAFERYSGAVAAGQSRYVHLQADAIWEFGSQLVREMRASANGLRAYGQQLIADPNLPQPFVASQADLDSILAVRQRIRISGFLPEELAQLASVGFTAEEVTQLRAEFDRDVSQVAVGVNIDGPLSQLADDLEHAAVAFDAIAREALSVSANTNASPVAAFTFSYGAGAGSLAVTFTSTSSDPDNDSLSTDWDFGDGVTASGSPIQHTYSAAGTYAVVLTASDRTSSAIASRQVTVPAPTNRAPVAVDDTLSVPISATSAQVNVLANDSDPDGDALRILSWTNGANGLVSCTTVVGNCTYFPSLGFAGSDSFSYTIVDDRGGSASANVLVTANQAPITVPDLASTPAGQPVTFNVLANDTDADGDLLTLTFAPSSSFLGAPLQCLPTGACTYTPSSGFQGWDAFNYIANDGHAGTEGIACVTVGNADGLPGEGFAVTRFATFLSACTQVGGVGPIGVAFDAVGRLYVGLPSDGSIHRFGAGGGVASAATRINAVPIPGIGALAFTADGRLYAGRASGQVLELDRETGAVLRTVAEVSQPHGLAVDPVSGDLFIGVSNGVARITDFTSHAGTVTQFTNTGSPIDGLTFSPDGTLWGALGAVLRIEGTNAANPGAATFIADLGSADGVAVATIDDLHADFLAVNRNDGIVTKVALGTTPPALSGILSGGSRGDFIAVGPDGCPYATQSQTILKITNSDGSCSFAPTLPPIHHLVLVPATATIAPGATQTYTARAQDVLNHDLGDVTAVTTFSIQPDGFCAVNRCSSTIVGLHTVTGLYGEDVTGTATLTVSGAPIRLTLTVAKFGGGDGTVMSSPPGIDCGATCEADYLAGTAVTLSAIPAPSNSAFVGWFIDGVACPGLSPCVVLMDRVRTVNAVFLFKPTNTLTIEKRGFGGGTVTINPLGIECLLSCAHEFAPSDAVDLTAVPNAMSTFAGWTGACSGTGPCHLTLDASRTVTAAYNVRPISPTRTQSEVNAAIVRGVDYIDSQQNGDGSFGGFFSVAETSTAILAYGVLDRGDITNLDPDKQSHLRAAISWLLAQQNPSTGDWGFFQTYYTGLALAALGSAEGIDPAIPAAIQKGRGWLLSNQQAPPAITGNPNSPDCSAADDSPTAYYCGGWNYESDPGRSDESNTGFALTGLGVTGGVPFAAAQINIGWQHHVQELSGNPFAQRNDGGGDYLPGVSSGGFSSNANNTGSLIFGYGFDGVPGSDPRVAAAIIFGQDVLNEYELIKETSRTAIFHFGAEEDGICPFVTDCDWAATGDGGYHYSLWALTKGLGHYISPNLTDGTNWYAKVADLLLLDQMADGSWLQDARDDGTQLFATGLAIDALGLVGTPHTLTITKDGTGSGSVSSTPAGIECGPTCTHDFADGTSVTLSASAAPGSTFVGWSGDGCTGTADCTVKMNVSRAVTATFATVMAHLTLTKTVINDNGGTAAATAWTLSANGQTTISGTTGSPAVTNAALNPGTYTLTESGPSGYNAGSWSCAGGTLTGSSLVLAAGTAATCTITNDDTPPSAAQLTVIKHIINNSGGTKTAGDFTLSVTGTSPSPATFTGSESGTIVTISAGSYSVDELTVAGYSKTLGTNCSGTIAAGESKSCTITNDDQAAQLTVIKHVINNNRGIKTAADFTMTVTGSSPSPASFPGSENGSVVSLNAGRYSVDELAATGYAKTLGTSCSGTIALGESKTCTITNDDQAAQLTVIKHVVNNNGGTKTAADFALTVTGSSPSSSSFPGSETGTLITINPGSYGVDETAMPGYATSLGVGCSGTIAAGESKTCTITNDDKPGQLTVIKHVVNNNGGTSTAVNFTLTVIGGSPSPSSFAGSESGTLITLNAGSYNVDETAIAGYAKTLGSGCSGTIALGESKSCTVTNDDQPAQLTVIKHVINNNGGSKTAADFAMIVTGVSPSLSSFAGNENGTVVSLNVGSYSVDELTVAGYSKTLGTNCSGTIAAGESKSCTITNDDQAAQLTVIKHVINNNGGIKTAADFTMTVTGSLPSQASFAGSEAGTSITINAGAYSVDETAVAGYTKSLGPDCSGTIALGESKSCTITNDDKAATLTVVKHVINNNGGTKTAADFTMTVAGGAPSLSSFAGSENGTIVSLNVGSYSVDELAATGYTKTVGASCSGTIASGESRSCTITNDDQPSSSGGFAFITGGGQVVGRDGTRITFGGNAQGTAGGNDASGHFNLVNHGTGEHYQGDVSAVLKVDASKQEMTFCFTTKNGDLFAVTWSDAGERGNLSGDPTSNDRITLAVGCADPAVAILWGVDDRDTDNGNIQWHPR